MNADSHPSRGAARRALSRVAGPAGVGAAYGLAASVLPVGVYDHLGPHPAGGTTAIKLVVIAGCAAVGAALRLLDRKPRTRRRRPEARAAGDRAVEG